MKGKVIVTVINEENEVFPAEKLFGKDVFRLSRACRWILEDSLNPFYECYTSVQMASLRFAVMMAEKQNDEEEINVRKQMFEEWMAEHPDEVEKERVSMKECLEKRNKYFKEVYGIARRHHLWLKWCGSNTVCCEPDRWMIFKNGRYIGRIEAFGRRTV